ncbi:hypothetical protein WDM22_22610 [Bradyrhizobium septentrionale]|uniref:hypothetical protein n=1 Tax=Bradyrhizobium septentrionale TaxID=1404411 RepID=UPI0030D2B43B
MDFKGWDDLDTRQWWIAVLVVAGPLLIGAESTGHTTTAIVAAGAVVWAIGEWIQHPFQQFRRDGLIGSTYHRKWHPFGFLLNLIGIAVVVWGIYRFWKLGGALI